MSQTHPTIETTRKLANNPGNEAYVFPFLIVLAAFAAFAAFVVFVVLLFFSEKSTNCTWVLLACTRKVNL